MKKIYMTLVAAVSAMTAMAVNPVIPQGEVFTLDAPAEVPMANPVHVPQDVLNQHIESCASPLRARALDTYNLSGDYVDLYVNPASAAISGYQYSENVKVTQVGNNIYFDGMGGFGSEALKDNDTYEHISPITGTINPRTGQISIKGGQVIAGIKGGFAGLTKVIIFPGGNGYINMTNGTDVWAHVEGNKIVWDKNILFCPAEGAFGFGVGVSNTCLGQVYSPRLALQNGTLSFSTVENGETVDYSSRAWYEYIQRGDQTVLRMSNVMIQNGTGLVTEWVVDGNQAVAEAQPTWYDGQNFYYMQSRTSRGQYLKTVVADISERQHIVWPVKFGNNKVVNWSIKANSGDPIFINSVATLNGDWYENYPTLYILNDYCGWDVSAPIEVNDEEGNYEYELPEDVTEIRISTSKGENEVDDEGFSRGAYTVAEGTIIEPGQVYQLIEGSDEIKLAEADEVRTLHVDLDMMTISVTVPVFAPIDVYFNNADKHWENPVVIYSKDNGATWKDPIPMTRYFNITLAPARVPDFTGDGSEELWVCEIPENATHVKFSDGVAEETEYFPVAADLVYDDKGALTGVEAVKVANTTSGIYYNLQGIRVANPETGKTYILVSGGKGKKVRF